MLCVCVIVFFFQAEDGIRDLVRSRGLGDVYKRQHLGTSGSMQPVTSKSMYSTSFSFVVSASPAGHVLSLIHI